MNKRLSALLLICLAPELQAMRGAQMVAPYEAPLSRRIFVGLISQHRYTECDMDRAMGLLSDYKETPLVETVLEGLGSAEWGHLGRLVDFILTTENNGKRGCPPQRQRSYEDCFVQFRLAQGMVATLQRMVPGDGLRPQLIGGLIRAFVRAEEAVRAYRR